MITKKAYATIADYCEQENANLHEVWTKVEWGQKRRLAIFNVFDMLPDGRIEVRYLTSGWQESDYEFKTYNGAKRYAERHGYTKGA